MSEKKKKFWDKFSQKDKLAAQADEGKLRKTVATTKKDTSIVDEFVITEENLPDAIADHIEHLVMLEEKMTVARKRARNAKALANDAKSKPATFFGRRKAIEALQESSLGLANANTDLMEALALSFADQRKIGEILNQMLLLCVSNLAGTRSLIGQLEAGLRKVEKGGYSEDTKAEMARIIRELKAREDMMIRQEKHAEALKEYGVHLQAAEDHLHEHDARHNETAEEVSQTNQLLAQTRSELEELKQMYSDSEEARLKSEMQYRLMLLSVAIGAVLLIILF